MAIIIIKTAKITDITIITVVNFFLFAFDFGKSIMCKIGFVMKVLLSADVLLEDGVLLSVTNSLSVTVKLTVNVLFLKKFYSK